MPGKRKEGKRLWRGYLEATDVHKLDAEMAVKGFLTRTEFLTRIAGNCKMLATRGSKSATSGKAGDEPGQP